MGPRTRRRRNRILFWRMFDHPIVVMLRSVERQRRFYAGQNYWHAYTRRRRALYPDSVADWECT